MIGAVICLFAFLGGLICGAAITRHWLKEEFEDSLEKIQRLHVRKMKGRYK
jgi:hypothetical protein